MMEDLKAYLNQKHPKVAQKAKQIKNGVIKTAKKIKYKAVQAKEAVQGWIQEHGKSFGKKAVTVALVGTLALGTAACSVPNPSDVQEYINAGCTHCQDGDVNHTHPDDFVIETTPEETQPQYDYNATPDDVMSSLDGIASVVLKHDLIDKGIITKNDYVEGRFVAICPPVVNGNQTDYEMVDGKYVTTLLVEASINGGQLQTYEVENFMINNSIAEQVFGLNDSYLVEHKDADGSISRPGDPITSEEVFNTLQNADQNTINNIYHRCSAFFVKDNIEEVEHGNNCM